MSLNNPSDKVSFEQWLVNLNEELEVPLELLGSTLKQLAEGEGDATRKEQLQIALELGQRFAGLMHNLNLAAKEQTQLALLQITPVSISGFLTDLTHRFQSAFNGFNTTIHLHINCNLKEIYTDTGRLYKILSTLLANAAQFGKEGGARIDVALDCVEEGVIRISVQDDGIGIVSEKLDHVFNPLYDDDPVHLKLYQSTSAGLYLALLYARTLGGNIKVESEKMVFTRFVVTLPVIQSAEDIPYGNFEMVSSSAVAWQAREGKVSVTRDFRTQHHSTIGRASVLALCEPALLNGFEAYFNFDVRLMTTTDSALAIARAMHLRPDLILLQDKGFGDITSEQVAKTLKSHEITKKIPMVWIGHGPKFNEADLSIDDQSAPRHIFEKVAELMNLRKKLIKELMEDKARLDAKPRYQNNKQAFLTRLERIVDAHIGRNDLDMDKLSDMLFLNRSQIHRKIKSYTGMNTTEYIRNYKLKLAYGDLESQSGTIAEVAYKNGFNSPSYFTKSFKATFGVAPSLVLAGPGEKQA